MSKKILLILLSILIISSMALASCAPAAPEEEAVPPSEGETAPEPEAETEDEGYPAITVWAGTGPEGQAIAAMAETYTKETGNVVNMEMLSRSVSRERLLNALVSGNSEPDIMYMLGRDMFGYAGGGFLEPLDDWVLADEFDLEDIPELLWESGTFDDTWYLVPMDASQETIVYRSDLIDEPPETYEELQEMILEFTQSHNPDSPTKYGYAYSAGPNISEGSWMGPLEGYGGFMVDENGNVGVDSPEAIQTWQYLLDLKCEYKATPPDITAWDYPEILTGLQEGVLAMASFFNAGMPVLYDCEQTPDLCGKFGYSKMPAGPEGPYTRNNPLGIAMNVNSEHKEAAWAFIDYIAGPEGSIEYTKLGGNSPRVSVLTNPEIVEMRPWTPQMLESAEYPALHVKHDKAKQLMDILHEWQSKSLTCEMSAEEALTGAAAEMRELLGEPVPAAEPVTEVESYPPITIWAGTGPEGQAIAAMAETYQEETGNVVNMEMLSRSVSRERLLNALVSGNSEPDAMYMLGRDMFGYAGGGFLEPLDDWVLADEFDLEDIPELLWESGTFDDSWYLVPMDASQETIVYRSDLIDEPPETYEELQEMILEFTQSHNPDSPTKYGYAYSAGPNISEGSWMGPLEGYGGFMVDEEGNVGVDSPEAIETWQYLLDLKCEYKATPPDITAWDYPEILTGLQEGVLALASFFNAGMPVLYDCEQTPDLCGKFGYSKMPAGPEGPYTRNNPLGIAMNVNSENKDATWAFINYISGPEGALEYTKLGGNSPRMSVLTNPEIVALRPWTPQMLESAEYPALHVKHDKAKQLMDILHEWQAKSLTCELSAEEALTGAAAEMRELLEE